MGSEREKARGSGALVMFMIEGINSWVGSRIAKEAAT